MDDKRIEDMLRQSWQPQPPAGMRERVLGRANREAERRTRCRWLPLSWRTAFAALGVLIVTLSAISDSARQSRLAPPGNAGQQRCASLVASRPVTLAQWRGELFRLTENPNDVRP